MSLVLRGDVISVINRKFGKDHAKAGQVYGRLYQLNTVVNEDGYVKIVDVDDFDLTREVKVGKSLDIPVYAQIYIPSDKDGKQKGEPRIQFHAIRTNGKDVSLVEPAQSKGVKV